MKSKLPLFIFINFLFTGTFKAQNSNDSVIIKMDTEIYCEIISTTGGKIKFKQVNKTIDSTHAIKISLYSDKKMGSVLKIKNPFNNTLSYNAFIGSNKGYSKTSVIPILPNIYSYEMWPYSIDRILLTNFSSSGQAQNKDLSLEYYNLGNEAFSKQDFKKADSLFSLSLDLKPHRDTYFNRAVCRQKLNNFKGYCIDLKSAANLGDDEGKKVFCKECSKQDTIYTKKGNQPATKADYESVEYIVTNKYNKGGDYRQYDNYSELLVSYETTDNVIVYFPSKNVMPAKYKGGMDSMNYYIALKDPTLIKTVIDKRLYVRNYVMLTIDELGNAIDAKVLSTDPDGITDKALNIVKGLKGWIPASYDNMPVKYKISFSVTLAYGKIRFAPFEYKPKAPIITYQKKLDDKETFSKVETMPEYPGGVMEMMKFIQTNIKYPPMARELGLTGKCFVKFVVDSDGALKDIEVLKPVAGCFECDDESVRVVQAMPKWKPATQNGKPVPVFFNLPINFTLK
jgi:TonB family protein